MTSKFDYDEVVRQQLSEGDRVTLTETRFSDGQVRYRLGEEDGQSNN